MLRKKSTEFETLDGDVVDLPSKWEICGTCDGHGYHAHAVDGNGFSSDDFDDYVTYFSGGYDSQCEGCEGTGKVSVADVREGHALYDDYNREMQFACSYNRSRAAERRMGY